MGVKTVRMEPEDEQRLARIRRKTGWTASDVLKHNLHSGCRKRLSSFREPLVTTLPVLTEAFHILSPESRAPSS